MASRLRLAPYLEQRATWSAAGRHIMAQTESDSVVVYQAYRPEIGHYTATRGRFGGGWSFGRFAEEWLLAVEDITPLVRAQREHASPPFRELRTPAEQVYVPEDPATATALGLDR